MKLTIKYSKYFTMALLMAVALGSCAKEDDDMVYNTSYNLTIKAVDNNYQDITSSGEVGDVDLYLFDEDQRYMQTMKISAEQVTNKQSVSIPKDASKNLWIVAWANRDQSFDMTELIPQQTTMQEAMLVLRQEGEGYSVNPANLFHGTIHTQTPTTSADNAGELVIECKMATLYIAVKGIDNDSNSVFEFMIEGNEHNSINFEGEQIGATSRHRRVGEFRSDILIAKTPFRLLPSKDDKSYTIYIYKNGVPFTDIFLSQTVIPLSGEISTVFLEIIRPLGNLGNLGDAKPKLVIAD